MAPPPLPGPLAPALSSMQQPLTIPTHQRNTLRLLTTSQPTRITLTPTPPNPSHLLPLLFSLYPHHHQQITPFPASQQGACSYTFLATTKNGEKRVLQVREERYKLQRGVMGDVWRIFGSAGLCPKVLRMEEVDIEVKLENDKGEDMVKMQIIEMTFLNGVSAENVLSSQRKMRRRRSKHDTRIENLFHDLASFLAISWNHSLTTTTTQTPKRPPPPNTLIASSIPTRLSLLAKHLPCTPFRHLASDVLQQVVQGGLDILPVVLNHGDFLPRNLLVDPETWHLTGVVDWGESEWLPFGMVVGGLEYLFGSFQKEEEEEGDVKFVYDDDADRLRGFFWGCLKERIGELRDDGEDKIWEAVMLARRVGILLWCGIAWDEGRRERVVGREEEGDREDLACLEAFLEEELSGGRAKL